MEFAVESEGAAPKYPDWEWRPVEGPAMDDLLDVTCLLRGKRVVVRGMYGEPGRIRCFVHIGEGERKTTCWVKLSDLTPCE